MFEVIVSDAIYVLAFVGIFCLLLCCGEWLFNLAYKYIPWVRNRWDSFCETLPEWADDDESEVW